MNGNESSINGNFTKHLYLPPNALLRLRGRRALPTPRAASDVGGAPPAQLLQPAVLRKVRIEVEQSH